MKQIALILIIALSFIVVSCGEDEVNNPPPQTGSDLTRSGKFISFTSNLSGNYDIYLAQVTSNGVLETSNLVYPTNPFNLTPTNTTDDKQSNWSPDGRILVFTRVSGAVQEVYAFFFNSNGSLDSTQSQNPRMLFSSGGNWDNNPSYSPSGTNLIWDRREDNATPPGVDSADARDLFIGDISGFGDSTVVTNIRSVTSTTGNDEYNPKWSPRISVRRVAYEYQSSSTSSDHDVYIIDPLDAPNNVNFYNPNNSGYPAWAPACDRIIFESDKSNGDFWKIVSLGFPSNNGQPTDVVAEANVHLRYPTWLPNGGLLAYIKFTGSNGNIYIVSTGGGTSSKLLQSAPQFDVANNLWPAW
jgi:hypothetical protein